MRFQKKRYIVKLIEREMESDRPPTAIFRKADTVKFHRRSWSNKHGAAVEEGRSRYTEIRAGNVQDALIEIEQARCKCSLLCENCD